MNIFEKPENMKDNIHVNHQTIEAAVKSSSSKDFENPSVLEPPESFNLAKAKWLTCTIFLKPAARPLPIQGHQKDPHPFPSLPQQPMSPGSIGKRSAKCSNTRANLVPNLPTSPLPFHQMLKTSPPVPLRLNLPRQFLNNSSSPNTNEGRFQFQKATKSGREPQALKPEIVSQMILQKCSHPLPTAPVLQNTFEETTCSFSQSQILPNHPRQPQFPLQRLNADVNNKKSHDEFKNNVIHGQVSKIRSQIGQFPDQMMRGSDARSSSENLGTLKAFRKRKIGMQTVSEPCQQNKESVLNQKQPLSSKHANFGGSSSELISPDSIGLNICVVCKRDLSIFSQRVSDAFLTCKNCKQRSHTTCLNLSEDFASKISLQGWFCNGCRQCIVCLKILKAEVSVSCKSCNLKVHLSCIRNEDSSITTSSCEWQCRHCISARQPELNVVKNGFHDNRGPATQSLREGERHPPQESDQSSHSEILKKWDDFEAQKSVPDISRWSSKDLSNFFRKQGFSPDVCKKFVDLEIDGHAALLMRRYDVLDSMGLKLGKALHIYNYIKKFQLAQDQ